MPTSPSRFRDRAARLLRSPWLHPLNDTDALNDLLAFANPRWSLTEIRAEVIGREPQTADTVSLWLRPNRLWKGFRAGQHVPISIEIDGVRETRVYSLSCDPAIPDLLALTIKRQPEGRVSNWLHDHVNVGDIVTLGAAAGDFVLPDDCGPVLLLSAGSGITPMLALLHELRARHRAGRFAQTVHLVHVCRDADDQIFAAQLRELARDWPALQITHWHSAHQGRPTPEALLETVADHGERDTWLCGPAAFMADLETCWRAKNPSGRLHLERFGAVPQRLEGGVAAEVRCARSERVFDTEAGEALLPAAERAGLKPAYGCRIGVCRTCLCHKRSGTVENLVTGERSGNGDEWIRLCVSTPRSDLELEL